MKVSWPHEAEQALQRIPSWETASRVARAVADFAERGTGSVQAVAPGLYALIVSPYVVRFSIDTETQTLVVWSVGKVL